MSTDRPRPVLRPPGPQVAAHAIASLRAGRGRAGGRATIAPAGYVSAGARVVVASRRADACKETEEHLRGLGGEAIGVPTHLAELDDLAELVRRTVDGSAAWTWW